MINPDLLNLIMTGKKSDADFIDPSGSEGKFIKQMDKKYREQFRAYAGVTFGAASFLNLLISDDYVENKNGFWKPTSKLKKY